MAVQAPAVYFYGVYKDFTVPANGNYICEVQKNCIICVDAI